MSGSIYYFRIRNILVKMFSNLDLWFKMTVSASTTCCFKLLCTAKQSQQVPEFPSDFLWLNFCKMLALSFPLLGLDNTWRKPKMTNLYLTFFRHTWTKVCFIFHTHSIVLFWFLFIWESLWNLESIYCYFLFSLDRLLALFGMHFHRASFYARFIWQSFVNKNANAHDPHQPDAVL